MVAGLRASHRRTRYKGEEPSRTIDCHLVDGRLLYSGLAQPGHEDRQRSRKSRTACLLHLLVLAVWIEIGGEQHMVFVTGLEQRQKYNDLLRDLFATDSGGIQSDERPSFGNGFVCLRPWIVHDVGRVPDARLSHIRACGFENCELFERARAAPGMWRMSHQGQTSAEMQLGSGPEHFPLVLMHRQ